MALLCNSGLAANAEQARPALRSAAVAISTPAGPLSDALIALAVQTGVSIGLPGQIPAKRVAALQGAMTVEVALRHLLRGTGLTARQTGPLAWKVVADTKIISRPPPVISLRRSPLPAVLEGPQPDIVVTATKTGDGIQSLPLSAHVLQSAELQRYGTVPTTGSVSEIEDGLVLSNLGPGRNKAFLRGISDSPFNGVSQSTVAVEMEDARVTFNAPDPELRLVDIDRVELLEGPQGPMHGTGALGGVYRIVPQVARTDEVTASLSLGLDAVSHGGIGESASAIVNLPLVRDTLALRAVAYAAREPGWIERDGPDGHDSNTSRIVGGRGNLRWAPAPNWTVDLSGVMQMLHVDDSQYVNAGSDLFERTGAMAEPHDNDFMNARLAVHGDLGWARLTSTTSWTSHEVDSVLDASSAANLFGQIGQLLFEDSRQYGLRSQEVRLSGGQQTRWLAGLSWLHATTQLDAKLVPASGTDIAIGALRQSNTEFAAFGQLSLPIWDQVRFDLGGRLFQASAANEALGATAATRSTRRTNFSPSASIGWTMNDRNFVYLRFASAYRPAGLSPFAPLGQEEFEADELQSAELGGRFRSMDGRLRVNTTAYVASWSHIQSDYLLANGLVATRNSGTGLIFGLETDIDWTNGWLHLLSGLDVQHAKLEKPQPGLPIPSDLSLPIVPSVKMHLGAEVTRQIAEGEFRFGTRLTFLGSARLSLEPTLNRRIDDRTKVDIDASYQRDDWSISLRIDNVLNSRADTFGYGNAFSIAGSRQITPQRPRSARLTISKHW